MNFNTLIARAQKLHKEKKIMKINFSYAFLKAKKSVNCKPIYPFDNKKQIERRQRIEGKYNIKNLL